MSAKIVVARYSSTLRMGDGAQRLRTQQPLGGVLRVRVWP